MKNNNFVAAFLSVLLLFSCTKENIVEPIQEEFKFMFENLLNTSQLIEVNVILLKEDAELKLVEGDVILKKIHKKEGGTDFFVYRKSNFLRRGDEMIDEELELECTDGYYYNSMTACFEYGSLCEDEDLDIVFFLPRKLGETTGLPDYCFYA